MPRGISVLSHPERYSKKAVERALKRKEKQGKKPSIIEAAMSHLEQRGSNGLSKEVRARWDILHFNTVENAYYIGGMKVDVFDADNAAEIVRRYNTAP